jgi:hypothetical protein
VDPDSVGGGTGSTPRRRRLGSPGPAIPRLRHPLKLDAEQILVGGQDVPVAAELRLRPVAGEGADQSSSADAHPAPLYGQRADDGPGEVRVRRGLLPPAGPAGSRRGCRGQVSRRYCGLPSRSTSRSPSGVLDTLERPQGIGLGAGLLHAQGVEAVVTEPRRRPARRRRPPRPGSCGRTADSTLHPLRRRRRRGRSKRKALGSWSPQLRGCEPNGANEQGVLVFRVTAGTL